MTRRVVAALAVAVVVTVLVFAWTAFATWCQYQFGFRNGDGNSPYYLFYSGFGSILIPPILTGLTVLTGFWWHHQCHVDGCYRYARKATAAGDKACWKHHPDRHVSVTADRLHARHHLALRHSRGMDE